MLNIYILGCNIDHKSLKNKRKHIIKQFKYPIDSLLMQKFCFHSYIGRLFPNVIPKYEIRKCRSSATAITNLYYTKMIYEGVFSKQIYIYIYAINLLDLE